MGPVPPIAGATRRPLVAVVLPGVHPTTCHDRGAVAPARARTLGATDSLAPFGGSGRFAAGRDSGWRLWPGVDEHRQRRPSGRDDQGLRLEHVLLGPEQ